MKQITQFIQEKLVINKNIKIDSDFKPKNKYDLRYVIEQVLKNNIDFNLNDIDVSNVIDMSELFIGLDEYNIDISKWNVSKVRDMTGMFYNCKNFNCDLSEWDVSKVEEMGTMFYGCTKFKGKGLKNWDTRNVKNMRLMFKGCKKFNEDLSSWIVDRRCDIKDMFYKCDIKDEYKPQIK